VDDALTAAEVEPLLLGRFGRPYIYIPLCRSTQKALPDDAPEGALAVTDEQTEGRGRLGRSWHAPAGTSILASLVLRPPVETARLPELTVVAGRAVAAAIAEQTGLTPALKFPNDVLVDGRKVAGILAEASEGRVVLGIGVNVNQAAAELPAETPTPPTSLRVELGRPVPRGPLLAAILLRLEHEVDAWLAAPA
jgi:BirA family transcriptional regulator, biotin operon repressor / biotin---[acetyl-CoA-carboxylase] ligase